MTKVVDQRPKLLFLCHRIPYPPDKGDKIRSYRWLKALVERFRVHLGAFIDDPDDWRHVERLEGVCDSVFFRPLPRAGAALRSLKGFLDGRALSIPYYRDGAMRRWVSERLAAADIRHVLVYSSAMAQYVQDPRLAAVRRVVDFVDVDSDKWLQYAQSKPWPLNWVYRRESHRLAAYERAVAREFDVSLFVSEQEAALFRSRLGSGGARVTHIRNGVDCDYFNPENAGSSPYPPGREVVVFTGAMDYWANADAVAWFAKEVWPRVRSSRPNTLFVVVGSNPGPAVAALAGADLMVTGRVPDVRPYLRHALVVVAPLRIARGIQNKVLEGMAMARPVVVTAMALEGIGAAHGSEVLVANDAESFAAAVLAVLDGQHRALGERARRWVARDFSWSEASRRLLSFV
ncbi:MAG: TIGR03087 family PEP-CTERM/XrtA system glycosyltransferase, partial [Chromatiaceae bacterium]